MKKTSILILLILSICLFSGNTIALTGQEILEKMDENLGVDTSRILMNMTLINEDGLKRERTIEILTKGENALVRFIAPTDVKGTALLLTGEEGESNMWLYLPALGSVRKVASHMQNGNFMGSDFTYQDFTMFGGEQYKENYQQTQLTSTVYEETECHLLDTIPISPDSGYSKIRIWVNQENYVALKLEFYDLQGDLLKTLTNDSIVDLDGQWTPQKITMENVQKNTMTVLELVEIQYNQQIPDQVFTTRNLEKK